MSRFVEYLAKQQRDSRSVPGSRLEEIGKLAAGRWVGGAVGSLHEAVVEGVKSAQLSPEQVRRVTEFANTNAYLSLFKKEGGANKYIDFGDSGPADPVDVLRDLNDGGGGTLQNMGETRMDRITPEGHAPGHVSEDMLMSFLRGGRKEASMSKVAHAAQEEASAQELWVLETKLASELQERESSGRLLEMYARRSLSNFYENVKEASREGYSLGEIVGVLQQFSDDGVVKAAMAAAMPRITSELFSDGAEAAESFRKEASGSGKPDPTHPLVTSFLELGGVLEKMASLRQQCGEVESAIRKLRDVRTKTASGGPFEAAGRLLPGAVSQSRGGILGAGKRLLHGAAGKAGDLGEAAGRHMFGGDGKTTGAVAKALTYAAPVVAAHEIYRRNLKNSAALGAVRSVVPGTNEYYAAEMDQNPYSMMGGY